MNPQPTIFISSIISEFYDLRGALKYFLGKSGFRVLMSEEPDFGADCGKDSLTNCKNQIEKSDYYLLIIGNKAGTTFEENGKTTSVTFEEFRHFVSLVKNGKSLNFIAFVRQQTWNNFENNDPSKIDPIQSEFIKELLLNPLFDDKKIGRWRYSFDKFADIIVALETNQNGLFLEATRKTSLYRSYIKREIYDILKSLLENSKGTPKAIIHYINIPERTDLDFITAKKIDVDSAANIIFLLNWLPNKEALLRKANRVFSYIAQGEFSRFDPKEEKYTLPEYIKLTMQTLEILEQVFDPTKNMELFIKIRERDAHKFFINGLEYTIVKNVYDNLNTAISKLVNLTNCFNKNWFDLQEKPDSFYSYGRVSGYSISDEEMIEYADKYFNTKPQTVNPIEPISI